MSIVSLEESDVKFSIIDEMRKKIAKIAVQNETLVSILGTILLEHDKVRPNMRKDLSEGIEELQYRIPEELEESFNDMKKWLIEYFSICSDYDSKEKLRLEHSQVYQDDNLDQEDVLLGYLRGNLLEAVVELLVQDRYLPEEYKTGCMVRIKNRLIEVGYCKPNKTFHRRKTIDFGGWKEKEKKGEFYECKCRPCNFQISNYDYLVRLNNEFFAERLFSAKIGLVTVSALQKVIEDNNSYDMLRGIKSNHKIYGIENIYELKNEIVIA